jgi:hypothetical protein
MRFILSALLLVSANSYGLNLSGPWSITEWSSGNPHTEQVTMVFGKAGELRTTTVIPGKAPIVDISRYTQEGDELVIIRANGEESRHLLESTGSRIKVWVPFGYFFLEQAPNKSSQPTPYRGG